MHDGTTQMWRITRGTFKHHGTLGNLTGVHLNSCPCILLSENTSSTVSFRLDSYIYFFCGHFLRLTEHGTAHVVVAVVFCINCHSYIWCIVFQHFSLVLYRVCDYINMTFHLAVGEPAWWATSKGSCRLPVHLQTVLLQSVKLYQ